MFKFEIISPSRVNYDLKIIERIFKIIDIEVKKIQKWVLNIVFVSQEEIKELNMNYRKKDYSTDVLSFHYFDDFSNLKDEEIAWELIFCEEKIFMQAEEYWLWEEKEFYKLLIHSILHILWFDHEDDSDYKIMSDYENIIWWKIFEN